MKEEKIAEFKEDFALLIEAGFIAVKQLDEVSAMRLFQAAQVLKPSHTTPRIGMGFIALNKMEVKKATQIFEEIFKQDPDDDLVQCYLGICYLLTKGKLNKGEKLIKKAMEKTTDPTITNLGNIALQWVEKDLSKKSMVPFLANQPDSPPEEEEKNLEEDKIEEKGEEKNQE